MARRRKIDITTHASLWIGRQNLRRRAEVYTSILERPQHLPSFSTMATTTSTTPAAANNNDDADNNRDNDNVVWLRIIQINDCYELDNMSSLKTIIDQHLNIAHLDLVILAGDFLGPSLLSSLNQGASMVDCLNACGFTHVCIGNHETDLLNMSYLDQRVGQSQFTWINSNIPTLNDVLTQHGHEMKRTDIVTVTNPKNLGMSKKVGLLGLLTPDPGLYRPGAFGDCEIQNVIETTHLLLPDLQQATDLVIPFTHQSMHEDEQFCNEFSGKVFPLVIGGHDHTVVQKTINGCILSKTGHDAEHVAIIDIKWNNTTTNTTNANDSTATNTTNDKILSPLLPTITVHPLLNTVDFEPNPAMAERVASHNLLVQELERARLFNIQDWLNNDNCDDNDNNDDGNNNEEFFSTVDNRLNPSTGTTAFCSMLRMGLHAQCAIINAGSVRGNKHYAPNTIFTYKELKAEIPYPTLVSAYYIPGHVLEETIWWSRRYARQDPPVAHGCYLHTCDAIDLDEDTYDDDGKITILSIQNKPFNRNKMYLTVVPIQFLLGIDHHEPLLKWAKDNNQNMKTTDEDYGVPAKFLIVEVFSTLVWLQMGSFNEMDLNHDGMIGRNEIQKRLQSIYGNDVAAVIVDNVMSMADISNDDEISPLEMAIAHFAARDMMNTSKHRGSSKRQSIMIRETVQAVLGQDLLSQEQADDIAVELQRVFENKSSSTNGNDGSNNNNMIDRTAIRNVMGGLRRKTLLGPQMD